MTTTVILGISIALQFVAVILALRLNWKYGFRLAWIVISAAIALMAARRAITMYSVLATGHVTPRDLAAELTALLISTLMVMGIALIDPIFHALAQAEGMLRDETRQLGSEVQRKVEELREEIAVRRETEQALRRSEERFLLAIRGTADGLWDWDLLTDHVWFAPRFKELLGYPEDGFPDTFDSFESRLHPDDYQRTFNAIHEHLQNNRPYDVEYRLQLKRGDYRWFRARGVSVRDVSGRPIRMAGSIQDISVRRKALEAMREAMEAAESASRFKGEFLANMSHEIRTPLNAIIGMTELVLDTEIHSAQREYLSIVRNSGESLLGVINDILDFSKIEAGKLQLESAPLHLREVLGDTMKSLAIRAHDKGLELAFRIDPDVPESLRGDAGRLRQVIVNLVGNAIKFTETGEVVLTVQNQNRTSDESILCFAVRDTGTGISPEKVDSIFDAFEQGDNSITRRFGGTGLGLSISRKLVNLMDGEITLQSEVGKGSEFRFTAKFGHAPAPLPPPDFNIRNHTVLIIDDNQTTRAILEQMLTSWQMQAASAESAEDARRLIKAADEANKPYEIVLVDMQMQTVGSPNLLTEIIAQTHAHATIIPLLTSNIRPKNADECVQLGVASQLMKPIKQSELHDAIMLALDLAPREDSELRLGDAAVQPTIPPLRILLAEDSLPNQKLAVGLLTRWGHTVTVANNGREALAMLQLDNFDLVLMDVQMPEMDGLQATVAIRHGEEQTDRHVPIVAMTAHAMKGDREQCLEAGMDDYVSKPIHQHELRSVLNHLHLRSAASQTSMAEAISTKPTEVVNWQAANSTVEGDQHLLIEIANAFLLECPTLEQRLDVALAQGDLALVQHAAHTLKASLHAFGAETAAMFTDRIQSMPANTAMATVEPLVIALKRHLKTLRAELHEFTDMHDTVDRG